MILPDGFSTIPKIKVRIIGQIVYEYRSGRLDGPAWRRPIVDCKRCFAHHAGIPANPRFNQQVCPFWSITQYLCSFDLGCLRCLRSDVVHQPLGGKRFDRGSTERRQNADIFCEPGRQSIFFSLSSHLPRARLQLCLLIDATRAKTDPSDDASGLRTCMCAECGHTRTYGVPRGQRADGACWARLNSRNPQRAHKAHTV